MYEDRRLRGHLHGIGYLRGGEYQHHRFREPALAAEQSSHIRISALEAKIAKLETTLSELVLLGMRRAALEE